MLGCKSHLRQYLNEQAWLYSNITLFMDIEMLVLHSFHISQNIFLSFQRFKSVKILLRSPAMQKEGMVYPMTLVC